MMRMKSRLLLLLLALLTGCVTSAPEVPDATPAGQGVSGLLPTSAVLPGLSPNQVPTVDSGAVSNTVSGLLPTSSIPTEPPVTPTPTFTPAPVMTLAPVTGGRVIQPGFAIARNETSAPILWRRCTAESGWADPSALCQPFSQSMETFAGQYSVPAGAAVSADGQNALAPAGYVSVLFIVQDDRDGWWAATSYNGFDMLPWCGAVTSGLAIYDLSQVPGYDPFIETPLNGFARLSGSLPAPLACP